MTNREEAIQAAKDAFYRHYDPGLGVEAAISAYLSALGSEPVAWRWRFDKDGSWHFGAHKPGPMRFGDPDEIEPLFAAPLSPTEEIERLKAERDEERKGRLAAGTEAVRKLKVLGVERMQAIARAEAAEAELAAHRGAVTVKPLSTVADDFDRHIKRAEENLGECSYLNWLKHDLSNLRREISALAAHRGAVTVLEWQGMANAPKDGTMLRLLVVPDQEEFTPFDDSLTPYETIGFNGLADTSEDRWEFAGWDWSQDCFITGRGEVIGWLAFHGSEPVKSGAVLMRDAIKWCLDRDEQNGSLPEAYAEKLRSALTVSPDGQEELIREMVDVGRRLDIFWKQGILFSEDDIEDIKEKFRLAISRAEAVIGGGK